MIQKGMPIRVTKTIVIRRGLGFFSVLTLLLILLKLLGNENITWLWIVASFFGPIIVLGLVGVVIVGFMIFCFLGSIAIDYYEIVQSRKRFKLRQEEQLKRRERNG